MPPKKKKVARRSTRGKGAAAPDPPAPAARPKAKPGRRAGGGKGKGKAAPGGSKAAEAREEVLKLFEAGDPFFYQVKKGSPFPYPCVVSAPPQGEGVQVAEPGARGRGLTGVRCSQMGVNGRPDQLQGSKAHLKKELVEWVPTDVKEAEEAGDKIWFLYFPLEDNVWEGVKATILLERATEPTEFDAQLQQSRADFEAGESKSSQWNEAMESYLAWREKEFLANQEDSPLDSSPEPEDAEMEGAAEAAPEGEPGGADAAAEEEEEEEKRGTKRIRGASGRGRGKRRKVVADDEEDEDMDEDEDYAVEDQKPKRKKAARKRVKIEDGDEDEDEDPPAEDPKPKRKEAVGIEAPRPGPDPPARSEPPGTGEAPPEGGEAGPARSRPGGSKDAKAAAKEGPKQGKKGKHFAQLEGTIRDVGAKYNALRPGNLSAEDKIKRLYLALELICVYAMFYRHVAHDKERRKEIQDTMMKVYVSDFHEKATVDTVDFGDALGHGEFSRRLEEAEKHMDKARQDAALDKKIKKICNVFWERIRAKKANPDAAGDEPPEPAPSAAPAAKANGAPAAAREAKPTVKPFSYPDISKYLTEHPTRNKCLLLICNGLVSFRPEEGGGPTAADVVKAAKLAGDLETYLWTKRCPKRVLTLGYLERFKELYTQLLSEDGKMCRAIMRVREAIQGAKDLC